MRVHPFPEGTSFPYYACAAPTLFHAVYFVLFFPHLFHFTCHLLRMLYFVCSWINLSSFLSLWFPKPREEYEFELQTNRGYTFFRGNLLVHCLLKVLSKTNKSLCLLPLFTRNFPWWLFFCLVSHLFFY